MSPKVLTGGVDRLVIERPNGRGVIIQAFSDERELRQAIERLCPFVPLDATWSVEPADG